MINKEKFISKAMRYAEVSILCAIALFFFFFIVNIIFPLQPKILYSQQIVSSDNTLMYAFLSADQKWRMKAELNEISPQLKKAIIYKEDKYFYYHYGVNPFAVVRAAFYNTLYRKRTSGASTISMQVARLMYPKHRTYLNKAIEMFRAVQLEWNYSKEEIIQMYFNLVPYGGNIEGVKAASLIYFGRKPDKMSLVYRWNTPMLIFIHKKVIAKATIADVYELRRMKRYRINWWRYIFYSTHKLDQCLPMNSPERYDGHDWILKHNTLRFFEWHSLQIQ